MAAAVEPLIRQQLNDRREKLNVAASSFYRPAELTRLLVEVGRSCTPSLRAGCLETI
jgi:hypothetical protein